MADDEQRALGRLEGRMDAIQALVEGIDKKMDTFEARMHKSEVKSAQYGGVIGGLAAVGLALIKEKLGLHGV